MLCNKTGIFIHCRSPLFLTPRGSQENSTDNSSRLGGNDYINAADQVFKGAECRGSASACGYDDLLENCIADIACDKNTRNRSLNFVVGQRLTKFAQLNQSLHRIAVGYEADLH